MEGVEDDFLMKDGAIVRPEADQKPRELYDENGVGVRNTLRISEDLEAGRLNHPMMGVVTNDFPPFFHVTRPKDTKPILVLEVATPSRAGKNARDYEKNFKLTGGAYLDELRVNALGIFESSASPKRLDWSCFNNHEGLSGMCEDLGNINKLILTLNYDFRN